MLTGFASAPRADGTALNFQAAEAAARPYQVRPAPVPSGEHPAPTADRLPHRWPRSSRQIPPEAAPSGKLSVALTDAIVPESSGGTRHLTRNVRARCVMARAQRAGHRFYRCFALKHYATWEAAEAAARLWLRPALARLQLIPLPAAKPTARNRSGVVGVFFRPGNRVLKTGRATAYPCFVARWPGARAGVKWMFLKSGGEDGAFLRACLSRELQSADRCRVEWALRSLTPERRAELLALKGAAVARFRPGECVS